METEPIVGWRLWEMFGGKLYPYIFTGAGIWPARQAMVARHVDSALHCSPPPSTCICGIYAYREQPAAFETLRQGHVNRAVNGLHGYRSVLGEVYLWGWVAEHENGYRAEFAYPKSIYVGADIDPVQILELEEAYGVPVRSMEELWVRTQT